MRFSFILFLAVCTALAVLLTLNALRAQESPSKVKPAVATVLNYNIAPIGPVEEIPGKPGAVIIRQWRNLSEEADKPTTESLPKGQEEDNLEQEELESLKRAWKRHEEQKKEEYPSGASSEEQDPLEAIAGKMKIAERRLSEEDPGDETQKKQLEAIDLLNDLIKKAEEAAQQQQQRLINPSRSNPARPESQRRRALTGKTEREQKPKRKNKNEIAPYRLDLPAREREDAQTPDSDQFPEKYRKHLERYYKEMLKDDKMK
jgi:hypothetical protein